MKSFFPKIKSFTLMSALSLSLIPQVASAAAPKTFGELINLILSFIGKLIPFVASLALLIFFWKVAQYILKAGDEKSVSEGRMLLMWGTLALFVMVSVWGIVALFSNTFGFDFKYVIPLLKT